MEAFHIRKLSIRTLHLKRYPVQYASSIIAKISIESFILELSPTVSLLSVKASSDFFEQQAQINSFLWFIIDTNLLLILSFLCENVSIAAKRIFLLTVDSSTDLLYNVLFSFRISLIVLWIKEITSPCTIVSVHPS